MWKRVFGDGMIKRLLMIGFAHGQ